MQNHNNRKKFEKDMLMVEVSQGKEMLDELLTKNTQIDQADLSKKRKKIQQVREDVESKLKEK